MRNASQIIEQWEAMSMERLRAAKALLDGGFYRDSVSRSYYAAYCAATSRVILLAGQFAQGRRNPSHEQLPDLIANTASITVLARRKMIRALRFLRHVREDADYRPHALVNRSVALDSIHNAILVQNLLNIGEKENDQAGSGTKSA
ncbi:MAG: HEPN domain-containing protein [Janthinobacterium lividum]